mmetsp:Transcript_1995/g.7953  ORF Transcript_1995/g.7953 Transcript_1995/m.7953 type:complete len:298 (+) Transcript_1995:457-1350(+)
MHTEAAARPANHRTLLRSPAVHPPCAARIAERAFPRRQPARSDDLSPLGDPPRAQRSGIRWLQSTGVVKTPWQDKRVACHPRGLHQSHSCHARERSRPRHRSCEARRGTHRVRPSTRIAAHRRCRRLRRPRAAATRSCGPRNPGVPPRQAHAEARLRQTLRHPRPHMRTAALALLPVAPLLPLASQRPPLRIWALVARRSGPAGVRCRGAPHRRSLRALHLQQCPHRTRPCFGHSLHSHLVAARWLPAPSSKLSQHMCVACPTAVLGARPGSRSTHPCPSAHLSPKPHLRVGAPTQP